MTNIYMQFYMYTYLTYTSELNFELKRTLCLQTKYVSRVMPRVEQVTRNKTTYSAYKLIMDIIT